MNNDASRESDSPGVAEKERTYTAEEVEQILLSQVAIEDQDSQMFRKGVWQIMRLLNSTGRIDEGIVILDWLSRTTTDPAELAQIALAKGQNMEAVDEYEKAAEAYSAGLSHEAGEENIRYLLNNNLGYSLNQLGRHSEAERYCSAAIQIDPERYNAHKNIGLAYQGQARYAEAARSFITANGCKIRDGRALRHLEELVASHPELRDDPGLGEQLENCQKVPARSSTTG